MTIFTGFIVEPISFNTFLYKSLGCISMIILMGWLLYRLMFSSLSKIPGPWYTNLSVLFLVYHEYRGSKRLWIHNLHLKYGESVRIAPNELSFASATAIKEIYTSAGGYAKTELYSLFQHGPHRNLFTALDKKEVGKALGD